MKSLLLLLVLASGAAEASTLAQIPVPSNVTGSQKNCYAVGFSASGEVIASCRGVVSQACSGRGCQPLQYITTYNVLGGVATACKTVQHHLPQADVTTYVSGYNAASCPDSNANPTGSVVTINGVPYYYVSAGPAGEMLVNSNTAGHVVYP